MLPQSKKAYKEPPLAFFRMFSTKKRRSKPFLNRDILSINDFNRDEIITILEAAKKLEKMPDQKKKKLLEGKVVSTLFFEPSTRTRLSFESSALQLGGKIIGFADPRSSSQTKGESLHDTIKMIEYYADVVVMRHPIEGAARAAAEHTNKVVINAGDGANQHPTQTFLDLYTIKKSQKNISGLQVALVGDLKYGRTVHSLATALSHFDVKLFFVSPDELKMPNSICEELTRKGIPFSEKKRLQEVLPFVDVLYVTRIQKERFPDPLEYNRMKDAYILKKNMLNNVKKNLCILHPLPRVNEINTDVDDTAHAQYFKQAGNGIPVRQALLALVTGAL